MKAKIVTFDSRSELKSWFDLRGEEDRAIIFSHRETLPNNMVKYEAVVVTRQGTQRLAEKATTTVRRFIEKGYTGTLGITTRLAEGVRQQMGALSVTNATGSILSPKGPSFATKIIAHLKEFGQARDAGSINKAIGYSGPGLGSIYTTLTKQGKVIRLARGYYVHPDHAKVSLPPTIRPPELESFKEKIPNSGVLISTPRPTANAAPFANRLVTHNEVPTVGITAVDDEQKTQEMLGWLGSVAVKRQSPELFEMTLRLKTILSGHTERQPVEEIAPTATLVKAPEAILTKTPEAILTERQLDFGAYLEDKAHRDVTPKELVENVLKMEYNLGQRHRYIYDTDLIPHGWYRTREDNMNVWRHESRRRSRRALAQK